MTERKQEYDPFKAKGSIMVRDTTYKCLKRFIEKAKPAATIQLDRPKVKR